MSDSKRATVAVLGAGRVGSLIARDLADDEGLRVRACDGSEESLARLAGDTRIECRRADLSSAAGLAGALDGADLAVGAVPGALGHALLERLIEAGCPTVDIAFAPEDPFRLDAKARERGVPVVVDCGVAPGLSNWFVGRSSAELEQVERVEVLVGGLPVTRVWPFEYRSVFSPTDVIEEYTRPCRMRVGGVERVVPALTGIERVDLPGAGTLEAFNTDGLRSLLDTCDAPDLVEKTLRFPGHADRMAMLRESGFFDERPRRIGEVEIVPRELTETLLFEAWTPKPGEEEFTVLRVAVDGRREGRTERHLWDLYDRTDLDSGATSMSRTTGFPCALVIRMLADGRWHRPGVAAPEHLGRDEALTAAMLDGLAARDVAIRHRVGSPADLAD